MEGENRLLQLQEKWNLRYQNALEPGAVVGVLKENQHLLPSRGSALDLASGLGANALYLAASGLQSYAWDLSDIALEKIQQFAKARELSILTELRDVEGNPPAAGQFDVIVVSHFLNRNIIPSIIDALKPKGLIFYQTFTQINTPTYTGPLSTRFTLAENELLQLFSGLTIKFYREEGVTGDIVHGFRNVAMLVAEK